MQQFARVKCLSPSLTHSTLSIRSDKSYELNKSGEESRRSVRKSCESVEALEKILRPPLLRLYFFFCIQDFYSTTLITIHLSSEL